MPRSTPVLFVRHGEVAVAHRGTFYGGAEVPLSPRGLVESSALAERLAQRAPRLEVVASSPLTRARAVADPLAAALGVEPIIENGFRELDRGDWTHVHKDAIESGDPGAILRYLADPESAAAPGGERESDFTTRVWRAVDGLVAQADGRPTIVVCHGHVIRAAMRRLMDWDGPTSLRHFVPYHAVVETRLTPDGAGELLSAPEAVLPEALRDAARQAGSGAPPADDPSADGPPADDPHADGGPGRPVS